MKLPETKALQFDPVKHAYRLNGKLLSGVTTIIDSTSNKSNLIQWAANMAADHIKDRYDDIREDPELLLEIIESARKAHVQKKDKASNKGTDIHALVEDWLVRVIEAGGVDDVPHDPKIIPFVTWATINNVEFLATEQRLYSETHGYAGTCDFVALIDGKLTIGDLKTFPKMWSADPFIQMGAYSLAWKEMTGEAPQQSVIVKMCDSDDERLKKYGTASFAVYPRYSIEEDEQMFLTRLKMYRYNQNFVSPKD